ncbi:MAG: YraN family protein [Candidatus Hydrogenedentes bacterium]|nr:YraN family protein [Candidatus Hydrogenedentota bacterium]
MPLGRRGEDLAAAYLRRAGYRILKRNVRLGRYEVDIIAQEKDTVAFVEVKTRRSDSIAAPEENVSATKKLHLRKAAHHYLTRNNDGRLYYRFDVVAVLLPDGGKPTVTLYRDAFRDE